MKRESFLWERENALRLALRRSVSAGSLSFAGRSECSNARKRSKLWSSDSPNDAGWIAGGDREGEGIFVEDEAGANDAVGA